MDFESFSPPCSSQDANESREETNMLCACLTDALTKLKGIWSELGISASQRHERRSVVFEHLRGMLNEMVEEEMLLKAQLLESVESSKKTLLVLVEELKTELFKPPEGLTILQLEKVLRLKCDELEKIKHERMKGYTDLRILEKEYCDRMCLPPLNIGSVVVPTTDHLKELEDNIKMLQEEQDKRLATFSGLRKSILAIWEDLELKPSTPVENELVQEQCLQTFELSLSNLESLNLLKLQLDEKRESTVSLAKKLRGDIISLYNKLEIDEAERGAFLARCSGYKPSAIALLENERARLQKLKMENVQKFVVGLRKELGILWDKCYFSESQKREFIPAFDENYTEELLATHEHQVEVIKGYYEDNKEMFKLIERRNVTWDKLKELEEKANDPNRFSNRGGNLLKEEREKKALQKAYPKIEKEVIQLVQAWEEEQERPFLLNGVRFVDFIASQKEECQRKKEEEKIQRHKAKDELMRAEMVFGSKPQTPKRKIPGTPSKTPNKSRRVNESTCTPSKFLHATHLFASPAKSITRSATKSATKQATKSARRSGRKSAGKTSAQKKPPCARVVSKHGRIKTPNRRRSSKGGIKRRVLAEMNDQTCKSAERDLSACSVIASSSKKPEGDHTIVACTSYSEFAVGLETSQNKYCRSSLAGNNHSQVTLV